MKENKTLVELLDRHGMDGLKQLMGVDPYTGGGRSSMKKKARVMPPGREPRGAKHKGHVIDGFAKKKATWWDDGMRKYETK